MFKSRPMKVCKSRKEEFGTEYVPYMFLAGNFMDRLRRNMMIMMICLTFLSKSLPTNCRDLSLRITVMCRMTETAKESAPIDPSELHFQVKELHNKPVRMFQFIDDEGLFQAENNYKKKL